jgi:PKD repeat protein
MKKVTLLLGMLAFCLNFSAQVQKEMTTDNASHVITCTDFHLTRPLSELSAEIPFVPKVHDNEESADRGHRTPQTFQYTPADGPQYGTDANVIQTEMGFRNPANKAPIKNWAGLSATGFRPQDPSGAAGPNHYIQSINGTPFRIYDKNTGANLLTANIGSLWSPATPNDGDPIIMYDSYADRWFISQFGQSGNAIYIAISQTADPTGAYYTYTFNSPQFPDYLKFSIWADGYYMTSNQTTDKIYVFERDQMLAGNPSARAVYTNFTTGPVSGFFVPLPADAERGLPTLGTPCPIFSYYDNAWGGGTDGVKIWNATVTWGGTPSLNVSASTQVNTASFDASYDPSWNDILQMGSGQRLDGIGGVPTYRAQWRQWSGYNSLLLTWGVKTGATVGGAAQRSVYWCELRQTGGVWSLYQEGLYAPDNQNRWLSSIAMDDNGSIALCYAKAGTTTYPSLCYTGRLATDPLGTMSFTETVAYAGLSPETSGNRYGDYAQTALDPDGQTFWHTGEYTDAGNSTKTRVYSFQLPAGNVPPVANFSADNTTPCVGSTVTFTDMSAGIPTSWAWTFSPTSVTYVGGTSSTSQNPQVQFNAAGPYTVTLVATNAYGSDSEIKTSYIAPQTGSALPLVENFEGATFPPTGWTVVNSDAPTIVWGTDGAKGLVRRAAAGNTGSTSGCAAINSYNYNTDTTITDALVSQVLDLNGASAPELRFKRAYKNYIEATQPQNFQDELRVFVSTDCGGTYGSAVYYKKGYDLVTNGSLNSPFTPASAADWDEDTVDLSAYVGQNIIVKFEISCKYGNNLYLDDINIDNTVATVASVTIASSDADNTICAGDNVTFTATPTNGGTAPTYQWQIDGVNAGSGTSTFSTSSLTNGQSVTVIMTSNLPGVTGSPATSNAIVTTVNAVPTVTAGSNSPVCEGATINLSATPVGGGTYAWSGPNSFSSTSQNPTIATATTADAGSYSVVVTANGCVSTASATTVVVDPAVTPSVSIALTTGNNPACVGESLTFTATPTNGGATPSYQWQVNGSNVGTDATTYTSASLNNGDVVTCVLTSNANCASPTTANSNSITLTVSLVTPSVSIALTTGNNPSCVGESLTFTATPTNGGSTPSYQWQVNGSNVGTNAATYTSASLNNGDDVTCILTSNASCASPTTANSNNIIVVVNAVPTVTAGSNSPVCEGTAINLTATTVASGTYAWSGPNSFSSTSQNPTIATATTADAGSYSVIVTANGCVSTASATSVVVNPSLTPAVSIAITTGGNPTCPGQSVTFTATPTNGGTPSYQWQLNGANVGTDSPTYTNAGLVDTDVVSCIMTSSETCASPTTANSNSIVMSVTATVTPAVVVTADNNPTCTGALVTFTAAPTNGGTAPSYQWTLNGVNVGANSATYTNNSLTTGDNIACTMTSNSGCASPSTASSNTVTMTVNGTVAPTVSIALTAGSNPSCSGNSVTFTATPTDGGSTPSYQWQVNGSNVGTDSDTYTTTTLNDADVVTCILTSSSPCASPTTANSNSIAMTISSAVVPAVSIIADNATICPGDNVTFTATPTNGGSTPSYQWQVNGTNVGTNSATYASTTLANGDAVTCIMTSSSACASPSTANSNTITITISTVTPTISIVADNSTICTGTNVTFTATPSNEGTTPTYQWTLNGANVGTSSVTYSNNSLNNGDVVNCTLTSSSTCASPTTATSSDITMTVTSSVTPTVSIALTTGTNPGCSGLALTFTATPTSGGSSPSYQWQVNGGNVGTNAATYTSSTLNDGDVVSCVLTSNDACASTPTANSNTITIVTSASVTPSVSVSASASTICSGSSVTFTASGTNGGTTPTYQWLLNGSNVGTNASTYTSTTLNNGDVVSCQFTSNDPCASTATVNSNNVTMSVSNSVTPSISTTIVGGSNPACQGTMITFTAATVNGGTSPQYQWMVDGSNVGFNSSTFSTSSLADGNVVTCTLTSNASCTTTPTATSTGVTMTINPIPATPSVTANGLTLTSSASAGNQWYLNGLAIAGATGQTYTATENGNYSVVVTENGCSSQSSAITMVNGVGIENVSNPGTHFVVYPNPNNGNFNLVFTSTEITEYTVQLRNVLGQVVFQEKITNFTGSYFKTFDITNYGKGEYFLTITNANSRKMEKVVTF